MISKSFPNSAKKIPGTRWKLPIREVTNPSVDISIIGGGIGGLAAALALKRAGFDAHVFERTQVVREVGGAVIVREPSMGLLESWGLHAIHEVAVPADDVEDVRL